ncbi:MAG: cysteine hydrolase family protein [Candidatus Krumholzibacteriia bacterium]
MDANDYIGPGDKPAPHETALLLVDIQNDYFPGGKNELEGSVAASRRAGELLALCRRLELPIIHVQHVSTRPGATYFLPDTAGVRIHESVAPIAGELVLQKHYPNAFRDKQLLVQLGLKHVARLVICGMMTHMCVDATVRAACDLKFECILAGDACAAKALAHEGRTVAAQDVHAAFLAALDGTYAKVMSFLEVAALLSSPKA